MTLRAHVLPSSLQQLPSRSYVAFAHKKNLIAAMASTLVAMASLWIVLLFLVAITRY